MGDSHIIMASNGVHSNGNQDNCNHGHLSHQRMELAFNNVVVAHGNKEILHGVSGRAGSGEMLAIMGPSGGGKTTLLNTLAGRQVTSQGEVTLNGAPLNKTLKRQISYVLQDDIFFGNLTLRETLQFTAMIRLPDHMPRQDKMERIEEVVAALDLGRCLDTMIGDAWSRGLSGGEKKRASIACEMLTDPKLLYMDEPTSGLDASTSLSLVSTLQHIASTFNKTVVLTIHQPSSKIFLMFNKLLLMCDGHVAYYGRTREVIDFFKELDFHMEEFDNPADFVVDKLKESDEVKKTIIEAARVKGLADQTVDRNNRTNGQYDVKYSDKGDSNGDTIKSDDVGSVHVSLLDLDTEVKATIKGQPDQSKWPSGYMTQFTQLTIRTFRQSKARILDKLKIIDTGFLSVLVSLIWFQLPRTEDTLQDRLGVLFFLCVHWGFTPLFDAVSSFPMEKMVIHKERSAGWYRLSAYYLAKSLSELPLTVL